MRQEIAARGLFAHGFKKKGTKRGEMTGFLLLIPFFCIRFILLSALNPKAVRRAAHFASMKGKEKIAYDIYQISTIAFFVYLIFLRVKVDSSWLFFAGFIFYVVGLCLCISAMVSYSAPDDMGLNTNGIYRFSRNPMYVAYFICFIGMALLTQSMILLGIIVVFQVSAHWIILAEERECIEQFGENYKRYMKKVRRYI